MALYKSIYLLTRYATSVKYTAVFAITTWGVYVWH